MITDISLASLARQLDENQQRDLQRLKNLVDTSHMVMYACRPKGDFEATFVSEGVRSVWGYEPHEFLNDSGFWDKHLHSEDAPRVFEEFTRILEAGLGSLEYRFRVKGGQYRWMHDDIRLVRDGAGKPLEIVGYCFDVTERKQAEAALRESKARLTLIFDSTSDLQALFRAETGGRFVVEAVNRALAESFRVSTGQDIAHYVGKDVEELLAATGLTEEELEHRRLAYRKVIEERVAVQFESPQSSLRDAVQATLTPLVDQHDRCTHFLYSGQNVTERLKAEAKLRESDERYVLVTQATHDGVFDWDLVTGDSYLSPRFKEILGYRDEELPNDSSSFFDRVHPDDSPWLTQAVARYSADRTVDTFADELRLRHKDGTYRWVVSRGRLVRDANGRPVRIAGALQDVTERVQAAAELLRAKEAAEFANRAKSEFLANMSHEIRTPMNAILALTEVVLESQLEPESREYLSIVRTSAESLLAIINDILDVSKIEAGKFGLEHEAFCLTDLIHATMEGLRVSASVKGLELLCAIQPGVPGTVWGDPGRLRQILINLVGNALKFTDRGQVAVVVEPVPESRDSLHFAVRDTGIGIPPDKHDLIFEAFTQVDGSATRKFGGTGLGLAIVSRLVKMMGGRIWVESKEGEGSTFHFTAVLPKPISD